MPVMKWEAETQSPSSRAASLELTAQVLPIRHSSSIVGGILMSLSSSNRILSLMVMLRWMPPVYNPDVTEGIQV